jgi:triacylglycerol lipase
MNFDIEAEAQLLSSPVKRAAYSDRTAWLMAVMSLFAYIPFEAAPTSEQLLTIAKSIAKEKDLEKIVAQLSKLASPGKGDEGVAMLETALGNIGFSLVKTFDVSAGLSADTQAFIARVSIESGNAREDMLVLSFRGTQPSRIADLKTDLDAFMVNVPGQTQEQAKVHRGFLTAFNSIKDPVNAILEANSDLPVYVTGHSLGGALALVATRYIANQSLGACYTFGGPRVCNEAFAHQIFTPVYRVVNGSDAVPAVPPNTMTMNALIWPLEQLPYLKHVVPFLKKMKDYRHHGDYRHLSSAHASLNADGKKEYPGLKLRTSPSLTERWKEFFGNWRSALGNHDIDEYVCKLAHYARKRAELKRTLNPDLSET